MPGHNWNRFLKSVILTPQGLCLQCMKVSFGSTVIQRQASRWSLGIDRSSKKPKHTVLEKTKTEKVKLRPKDARLAAYERMVNEDAKHFESGKRWLAAMMGDDPETFDEQKIREALDYLLPSHLFARDARPILKHPLEVYGQGKDLVLDENDRPLKSAFYTRQPKFHDLIFEIYQKQDLVVQAGNGTLPISQHDGIGDETTRWMEQEEMELHLKEKLKEDQHKLVIYRLSRLQQHPDNHLVKGFLSQFRVPIYKEVKERTILEIDEEGICTSMGYRKRAVAEVKVKKGKGKFLVNGQEIYDYFNLITYRQQLMFPFLVTDAFGQFDIDASVIGGGMGGQAGAIRLGVSRALPSFNEAYYEPLEEAGLLIRDRRRLERMKPGQRGARRKFQWVKR